MRLLFIFFLTLSAAAMDIHEVDWSLAIQTTSLKSFATLVDDYDVPDSKLDIYFIQICFHYLWAKDAQIKQIMREKMFFLVNRGVQFLPTAEWVSTYLLGEVEKNSDRDLALILQLNGVEVPDDLKDSNFEGHECSICMSAKRDITQLEKCSHSFCRRCVDPWIKKNGTCPLCRSVETEDGQLNAALASYVGDDFDIDLVDYTEGGDLIELQEFRPRSSSESSITGCFDIGEFPDNLP